MNHLTYLVIFLFFTCCARSRPVEPVYDFDENRWAKETFLTHKQWIGKSSIINSAGYNALIPEGIESSSRVGSFSFTRDDLRFYDEVNLYQKDAGKTPDAIFSWNISHSDYSRQVISGKKTNRVVEDPTKPWDAKQFFKVDWNDVTIGSLTPLNINCWERSSSRVVEDSAVISAEHITFVLEATFEFDTDSSLCISRLLQINPSAVFTSDLIQTLHIKYSFAPLPQSDYKPYLYTGETDPLHQKYGFFNTTVISLDEENQLKSQIIMDRWHPEKTHTYYFAENFPEEYKTIFNDATTGIFARTNELFKKHNLNMRFEIKENDGSKKFGDIRYSFVKIIPETSVVSPLGYGPHVANPFTGEIMSANIVLWTGELDRTVRRIQDRDERIAGRAEFSSIFNKMDSYLQAPPLEWNATKSLFGQSNTREVFDYMLPFYTYNNFSIYSSNHEPKIPIEFRSFDEIKTHVGVDLPQTLTERFAVHDEIMNDLFSTMKEEMSSKNHTTIYPAGQALVELDIRVSTGLEPKEAIQRILHRVALHEFGHNLNLRHNFYGSLDEKNFKEPVDGHQQRSSTVMEYLSGQHQLHDHDNWENYDEAALAFAYSSGNIDLSSSLKKNFLYCSDEHIWINAMCNRWDYGTTPSEIAVSLIDTYEDAYWVNNFKFDRAFWNGRRSNSLVFNTMWNLKKILMMYLQTYFPDEANARLGEFYSEEALLEGIANIRTDIKQANSLAAAFFGSVVQQEFTDRPFSDTYDEFTGGLRQKGIWFDKFLATRFLLGDDFMLYNPNFGALASSYLILLNDNSSGPDLKGIVEKVIEDIFVRPGPNYNGFDSIGRILYAINAAGYLDRENNQVAIDRMKITCFKPKTLEESFQLADTFAYPFPDGSTGELFLGRIAVTGNENTPHYFRSGTSEVFVVKISGDYYVASKEKNPYTFSLIESGNIADTLLLFNAYHAITRGRVPECL